MSGRLPNNPKGVGQGRYKRSDDIRNMIGSPQGMEMRDFGTQPSHSAPSASNEPPPILPTISSEDNVVSSLSPHQVHRPPPFPTPPIAPSVSTESESTTPPSNFQQLPQFPNARSPSPQLARPPIARTPGSSDPSVVRTPGSAGNHYNSGRGRPHGLQSSYGNSSFTSRGRQQQPTPPDIQARMSAGSAFSRSTTSPRNLQPPVASTSPRSRFASGSGGSNNRQPGQSTIAANSPQSRLSTGSSYQYQQFPNQNAFAVMSPSPSRLSIGSNYQPSLAAASPRSRLSTGSNYQPFAGQRLSDVPQSFDSPSMPPPSATRSQMDYDDSESDTSSVKEPFTDQVDSLNRLLTSPDRGLGPLAQTNLSPDVEDDFLDAEMKDMESSRFELQKELSAIDFSTFEDSPPSRSDSPPSKGIYQNTPPTQSHSSSARKLKPPSGGRASPSNMSENKITKSPIRSSISNAFGFFRNASKMRRRQKEYASLPEGNSPPAAVIIPDDGLSVQPGGSGGIAAIDKMSIASSLQNDSHIMEDDDADNDYPIPSRDRDSPEDPDFYGDDPSTSSARFLAAIQGRPDLPELDVGGRTSPSHPDREEDSEMTAGTRQKQIRASLDSRRLSTPMSHPFDEITPRHDDSILLPDMSPKSDVETEFFHDHGGSVTSGTPRTLNRDGATPVHAVGSFDAGSNIASPLVLLDVDDDEEEEEVVFQSEKSSTARNVSRQLPPNMPTDYHTAERKEQEGNNSIDAASSVDEHAYHLENVYNGQDDQEARGVPESDLDKQLSDMLDGKYYESDKDQKFSFDLSKMAGEYNSFETQHTTSFGEAKSKSSDNSMSTIQKQRRQRNLFVCFCLFLICCACVVGVILALTYGPTDDDDNRPPNGGEGTDDETSEPPSMSDSPSTSPSTSPTISFSPTFSPAPTAAPTITPQPTTTFLPSSSPTTHPSFNPTSSPSSHPSLNPTLNPSPAPSINVVSFETVYNIVVLNGLLESIPSDSYFPDLIESMDRLTLEVEDTVDGEGRRRLSTVILPSTIKSSSEVFCPAPNGKDKCEMITAEVNLSDAEDDWQEFKLILDLAIQIGRLQFHLDEIDPNSDVAVLDRTYGDSPAPSPAPSAVPSSRPSGTVEPTTYGTPGPTQYSLFMFLVDHSFDEGEALNDPTSAQRHAYQWLSENALLDEYSHEQILQRYAMATIYFSTNGDDWFFNDGWLSDDEECDWYNRAGRRACNPRGELKSLELDYNNLNGELPIEVGHLSEMERLILRGGPSAFTGGTLPTELGYLTGMKIFFVQNNLFTGNIPPEIGSWTELEQIDLSHNRLVSTIPTEVGNFEDLRFFNIGFNNISGSIPSEIGLIDRLQVLNFEHNFLAGRMPSEIGLLDKLQGLNGGMNLLTSIPPELGQLTFCDTIILNNNNLQGTIPTSIGDLPRISK